MSGPWLAAGLLLVVAVGVAPPITIAIAVGDAPLADRRGAFSALAALTAAGLVIGGFYELIDHVRRRGVPPVVRTGGGFGAVGTAGLALVVRNLVPQFGGIPVEAIILTAVPGFVLIPLLATVPRAWRRYELHRARR
jgi:hypothetical protein